MKEILIPTKTAFTVFPCKVCKSDKLIAARQILTQDNKFIVLCAQCETQGPTGTPSEAVTGWNTLMGPT